MPFVNHHPNLSSPPLCIFSFSPVLELRLVRVKDKRFSCASVDIHLMFNVGIFCRDFPFVFAFLLFVMLWRLQMLYGAGGLGIVLFQLVHNLSRLTVGVAQWCAGAFGDGWMK